jgi:pimeloyl-ACP methyl ester carboxylesterase
MRLILILFCLNLSCVSLARAEAWSAEASFAIPRAWGLSQFPYGKLISVPLAPDSPDRKENFELFYFTPAPFNDAKKTILFVSGGPGRVLGPAPEDFAKVKEKYNIVFYHPRGGGLSQIPADRAYDKFLSSRNSVQDLEAIRRDLGISQWDLVYGFSHGTIVAQMYGHWFPKAIKRFIYDGAISYWQSRAKTSFWSQTPINVRKILELDDQHIFGKLIKVELDTIQSYVARMNEDLVAGGKRLRQTVIDGSYNKPETIEKFPILKDRSREFMVAVMMALYTGWSPVSRALGQKQQAVATVIAGELFPEKIDKEKMRSALNFIEQESHKEVSVISPNGVDGAPAKFPGFSERVFQIVATADPKEYIPSAYPHPVETLILHGSGDGASPIEGAREIKANGLMGKSKLFIANGSNHGAFFKGASCEAELLTVLVDEPDLEAVSTILHQFATKHLPDGLTIE